MPEIKTCEQYVLTELANAQKKNEELEKMVDNCQMKIDGLTHENQLIWALIRLVKLKATNTGLIHVESFEETEGDAHNQAVYVISELSRLYPAPEEPVPEKAEESVKDPKIAEEVNVDEVPEQ